MMMAEDDVIETTTGKVIKMDKSEFINSVKSWADLNKISFGRVGEFDPTLDSMFRDLETRYMNIAKYCKSRLEGK
jgi:hypothetical protein